MADQNGSETAAAVAAPAGDVGSTPSSSSTTSTPPARKAPDEMLCTICGLKACWTKPEENSPAPSST